MQKHTLFVILVALWPFATSAVEPPTKRIRQGSRYVAVVLTQATPELDMASWFLPKPDGSYDAGAEKAAEVLAHFRLQEKTRTKDGIFISSNTHSIPDTEKEKKLMSAHILNIYQHKPWRDAENRLVAELVDACNKEGIPAWINVSNATDEMATYKLLTDPKLTLKK